MKLLTNRTILLGLFACLCLLIVGCSNNTPLSSPSSINNQMTESDGDIITSMEEDSSSTVDQTPISDSDLPASSSSEATTDTQYPVYHDKNELIQAPDVIDIVDEDKDTTVRFGHQGLEAIDDGKITEIKYTQPFHEWWGPTGTEFDKITGFAAGPRFFYQNDVFVYLFFSADGSMDYNAAYIMCYRKEVERFTSFSQEYPSEELIACELNNGRIYVLLRNNDSANPNSSFRLIVFDVSIDGQVPQNAVVLHNELYDFGEGCDSMEISPDGVIIGFYGTDATQLISIEN